MRRGKLTCLVGVLVSGALFSGPSFGEDDKLSAEVDKVTAELEKLSAEGDQEVTTEVDKLDKLSAEVDKVTAELEKLSAEGDQEVTTEVRLRLHGGLVAIPPYGELVAEAEDGTKKTFPFEDGHIKLSATYQWVITCDAPQLWCPRVALDQIQEIAGIQQEDRHEGLVSVLDLPVYPGTWIRGRLLVNSGHDLPTNGLAEGHLKLSATQIDQNLSERIVVNRGQFRFKAPLGSLDLRLVFDEWAPVYRWQVSVVKEDLEIIDNLEGFDLGTVRLIRGSTVSGWVVDGSYARPLSSATLGLLPPRSGAENAPPVPLFEAECDQASGFFQIPAVAPGRYRLMASASGKMPTVVEDITVVAESETVVGKVKLFPPVGALFQITPPVHQEGAWRLLLKHTSPLPGEVAPEEVEVGVDGFLEATTLRRGRYSVQVLEPNAPTTGIQTGVFYTADHEIEQDAFLAIDLPILGVHGEVLLKGEPLASEIEFETGSNDKIRLSSDDEGKFRGAIRRPHLGFFFATVFWSDQAGEHSKRIELSPELPKKGDLELLINIHNRKIRGRVVDKDGRSIVNADVESIFQTWGISGSAQHPRVRSGIKGEFEFAGLESGLYRLRAEKNDQVSELVEVSTAGLDDVGGILLVLGSSRPVVGRLENSSGTPIQGAMVYLATSGGRSPAWTNTTTDGQGRFEVQLPTEAHVAVLTVMAPAETLWTACVTLPDSEEVQPWLLTPPPRPGGVLHFEEKLDPDLPFPKGIDHFLVNDGGGFLSGSNLATWASVNGRSQIRGPHQNLAPGHYSSYWHSGPWWTLVDMACGGTFAGLPGVALFDYGETVLKVDVKQHQKPSS